MGIVISTGVPGPTLVKIAIRRVWAFFALQVLEAKDERLRVIDHFMSARSHERPRVKFSWFELD